MEKGNQNEQKTRIYNLIILDKSGSMEWIRKAAYLGCNEVIGGIQAAAEKYKDKQEQFVSLMLFDSMSMPYIHKCTPAKDAGKLSEKDYKPCASTPLLDAMGMSLLDLEKEVDSYDDAVGMVTVITDGYENDSHEFTYQQIHQIVGRLKAKGWNFAFMGANQDVTKVCIDLNINIGNAHEFSYDEEGMRDSWRRDREAKDRYYERMRMAKEQAINYSAEERKQAYASMNESAAYFDESEECNNK